MFEQEIGEICCPTPHLSNESQIRQGVDQTSPSNFSISFFEGFLEVFERFFGI
jgi:hypothetical protein